MGQPFKLRSEALMISTEAPGGIYNSEQLRKITALCDSHGAVVKATEDQRLALFVPEAAVSKVTEELKAVGLGLRHYQDGLHQAVSCVGELCSDYQQDALGSAMDVTRQLAGLVLSTPLKIGINGCSRCCVPTHTLDISIIGDTSGYRVSIGGKSSQIPEMASFLAEGVPAEELPGRLRVIVDIYKAEASEGETLQELIERVGPREFIRALAPWSQDAAGADSHEESLTADASTAEISADESPIDEGIEASASDFDEDSIVVDDAVLTDVEDDVPADVLVASADDSGSVVDIDPGASNPQQLETDIPIGQEDDLSELDVENIDADELPVPLDDESGTSAFDDVDQAAEEAEEIDTQHILEAQVDKAEYDAAKEESAQKDVEEEMVAAAAISAPTTSAKAQASENASASDLDAETAGEDDESAFEAKLNESIAETEAIPVAEDPNAEDRMAAVAMLENEEQGAESVETSDVASSGKSMEDILEDELADASTSDASTSQAATSVESLQEELIFSAKPAGVAPAEGAAPASPRVSGDAALPPRPSVSFPVSSVSRSGGDEPHLIFTGVEALAGGKWSLAFESGAKVVVDPSRFSGQTRSFAVGGQQITVRSVGHAIEVEVDGIEVQVPAAA
jgi:hypothetical protein